METRLVVTNLQCLIRLFWLFLFVGQSQEYKSEIDLQFYLLNLCQNNYSHNVVPSLNNEKVFHVHITLSPRTLMEIDSTKQVLKLSGYLTVEWKDFLLVWNASDFSGIRETKLQPHKVWKPLLSLHNGVGNKQWLPSTSNSNPLYLYKEEESTTNVRWYIKEEFITTCKIEMDKFPNDIQICDISIVLMEGLYRDKRSKIAFMELFSTSRSLGLYKENSEWKLMNATQKYHRIFGRSVYTYTVKFRRNAKFYVFNFILPLCYFSLISVMVYILPTSNVQRLNIGVTILLSYTVFMLLLESLLPKSVRVPDINKYMAGTMTVSIISILGSAICLRLTVVDPHRPLPRCLAHFLKYTCWRKPRKGCPSDATTKAARVMANAAANAAASNISNPAELKRLRPNGNERDNNMEIASFVDGDSDKDEEVVPDHWIRLAGTLNWTLLIVIVILMLGFSCAFMLPTLFN